MFSAADPNQPSDVYQGSSLKVPAHTKVTVTCAGVFVGLMCALMLALDASLDWDSPPIWAHVVFSLVAVVTVFEYALGFRILGRVFGCEYTKSREELDRSTRRRRFSIGWFGITIPSLLLIAVVF